MECVKLLESIDIFGSVGVCVGIECSQILRNSLLLLQQENHFSKCYYWGKINGIQNDYHIAYGYQKDCMTQQKYYYSLDCVNWLLLPKSNKCGRFLTPLAVNKFEGVPSIVTNVYDMNPAFPSDEDTKQYYDGQLPKELKEEDRLAATVESIIEDAVIVPRGGWFKCPNGEIIENSNFQGVDIKEVFYMKSYLHARPPQRQWNHNLLTRPDYDYAIDFLDPIEFDEPEGCWKLTAYMNEWCVILNSLHWPGMTFYHRIGTPHYRFLYIGDGKKNVDLPFML